MRRLSRLRPKSLRGRVVAAVLALLLVLLSALFVAVDTALTAKLHSDLRTRLTDRVQLAEQLADRLGAQDLVNRLRGDGVTAQLCSSDGCVSADTGPPPPGKGRGAKPPTQSGSDGAPAATAPRKAAATAVQQSGPVLYVRTSLPPDGEVLTLSVDSSQVDATLHRLIVFEIVGGLAALLLAALLLGRIAGAALRPLDRMTGLARSIAGGDRGRRLGTGSPDSELGRTATAFDAMLDELESALAAASEAEARLRAFLNDVSHELRTPLTGVQATTETLLRDEPDRDGRERAYVTLIRETRRANRLVDDLLTMTRLDTGMRLAAETVPLRDLVRQEADRLVLLSPSLRLDATRLRDVTVSGDPVRLGQIVANLLDNARAAAGPTGRVWITLDDGADADGCARLEIADDGPGVPAEDRERIFDRLVRLDDSRARAGDGPRDGFGLGLPIARALARAHGGDLVCVGGPGGATFRLTLPSQPSLQPTAAPLDVSGRAAAAP